MWGWWSTRLNFEKSWGRQVDHQKKNGLICIEFLFKMVKSSSSKDNTIFYIITELPGPSLFHLSLDPSAEIREPRLKNDIVGKNVFQFFFAWFWNSDRQNEIVSTPYNPPIFSGNPQDFKDPYETLSERPCFSLPSILLTLHSLVGVLQQLHSSCFIARSVNPDNISIGFGDNASKFHFLDVSRFKKFWDHRVNQHIPYKEGKPFLGDRVFGSLNEHLGQE